MALAVIVIKHRLREWANNGNKQLFLIALNCIFTSADSFFRKCATLNKALFYCSWFCCIIPDLSFSSFYINTKQSSYRLFRPSFYSSVHISFVASLISLPGHRPIDVVWAKAFISYLFVYITSMQYVFWIQRNTAFECVLRRKDKITSTTANNHRKLDR